MKKREVNAVDLFISAYSPEIREKLEQVRNVIRKAAPDAEEVIAYGIPTFKLDGNLVHFSGYKNHIGFYPGASGIAKFIDELEAYKNAKGSVQFPLDQPLPLKLIKKMVEFRVAETRAERVK